MSGGADIIDNGKGQQKIVLTTCEDHLYANISVYNNTEQDITASFSTTRNQELLGDPSNFNLAVARFAISSNDIPLFSFATGDYHVSLVDISSGIAYTAPVLNSPSQSLLNPQNIFSINGFLQMINNAFIVSWTALNGAHGGLVPSAPFMIFDPATSLFSLVADPAYGASYPANKVQIWMNYDLYQKFEGMWIYLAGYDNPNFLDVMFWITDTGNNRYVYPPYNQSTMPTQVSYLTNTQDANPDSITDLSSIVFSSTSIPVIPDQIMISSTAQNSTGGLPSSFPIITDFIPDTSSFDTTIGAGTFIYNANLYRLIPLISQNPMRTIDLTAYYLTRNATLTPIMLRPNRSMNVKLVFVRKGLPN